MTQSHINIHKLNTDFDTHLVLDNQPLQKAYALDTKKVITNDVYEQACNITAWQQLYDQLYPGQFKGTLFEVWLDGVQFFKETTNLPLRQSCMVWPGAVWFGIPKMKSKDSFVCSSRVEESNIATRLGGQEFELLTPDALELMGFVISETELEQFFEISTEKELTNLLNVNAALHVNQAKKNAFWNFMNEALTTIEKHPERVQNVNAQKMMKDTLVSGMISLLTDAVEPKKVRYSQMSYRRVITQAREYILSHTGEPTSILELCNHLHVSRRTLQNAFQNILGICPLGYLKAIRLNAVRRELLSPYSPYQTIQDAATTWGFWHLSQFAADYHKLFNELPSETLANRGFAYQRVLSS
ncbi:HTH-type transcriptional regulator EutR [Neisseria sp. Ec49-e6-T10]|uniref:HTH-type transcriptional regulator EutR n=1 Tax=Neisseria sp. Ec49-e6-T10 TaxID=3140744 RepID=UPI003EBBFF0B